MGKGFGATELIVLNALKSQEYVTTKEIDPDSGYHFRFSEIHDICKAEISKEQLHSALGRLVRRGTVWKTDKVRPQRYWILFVVTRRI